MGITARDTSTLPAPTTTTRSQTLVRVGGCLTHTLRPSAAPSSEPDESTWARRARPEGVLGAEVWLTLIDAGQPAYSPIIASLGNLSALAFLTMATKPNIRADFRSGDGGTKQGERAPSSRLARSTPGGREEKRPWSEIATATVALQRHALRGVDR